MKSIQVDSLECIFCGNQAARIQDSQGFEISLMNTVWIFKDVLRNSLRNMF